MRSKSDPSVRLIMSALDRAAASPHNLVEAAAGETLVILVASKLLELGDDSQRLTQFCWDEDGCRALILALATNAPDGELRALVREARRQLAWIEDWDRKGWAKAMGYTPLQVRAA